MNLYADLRWPAFAERYASDPRAFAKEVCGIGTSAKFSEALPQLAEPECRLMLHNAGGQERQGVLLAAMALWHIATTPDSMTMLSSPADSASETNRAIAQLHKHMRTGPFYWLARGIKQRASGWVADSGRRGGVIRLLKASSRNPEALGGVHAERLLWLVEGGEQLPIECLGVIGGTMVYEQNALVIAHDWHVPEHIVQRVRDANWSLVDLAQSDTPTLAQRQERHQCELREFVELVAGKPLTSHQAAVLANLVQRAPVAQTLR